MWRIWCIWSGLLVLFSYDCFAYCIFIQNYTFKFVEPERIIACYGLMIAICYLLYSSNCLTLMQLFMCCVNERFMHNWYGFFHLSICQYKLISCVNYLNKVNCFRWNFQIWHLLLVKDCVGQDYLVIWPNQTLVFIWIHVKSFVSHYDKKNFSLPYGCSWLAMDDVVPFLQKLNVVFVDHRSEAQETSMQFNIFGFLLHSSFILLNFLLICLLHICWEGPLLVAK